METKVEASVAEPLSVPGQGVTLRGVGRRLRSRRADVTALEGVDLTVRRRRGRWRRRAPRAAASRPCSSSSPASRSPTRARSRWRRDGAGQPRRVLVHAPARPPAAVARRARQRRARAGERRACAAARRASAPRRCSSASAWPSSSTRARPRCRAGMRQRVAFLRTLLPGPPGAAARRAVRLAGRDHPRGDAGSGSPARSHAEPRTVILVTHDVEEALFLVRPGGGDVAPARAVS